MSAIWRREASGWRTLLPSGFPSEEALHDLVEEAPHLLPLSGDPTLVVVGREVTLGTGYADLVAVEPDGRLAIIEIKLRKNAEARRAVVAQVLMYAAFLKGMNPQSLEDQVLRAHFLKRPFSSLAEAAAEADQTGSFDSVAFSAGLAQSLATGSFRLVLVLDEAPAELVQLVGYLESVSSGILLDLITVSSYALGDEQILVPQRVDPEHPSEVVAPAVPTDAKSPAARAKPVDGSGPFEEAISRESGETAKELQKLLAWATDLQSRGLATLKTMLGQERQILLPWLPGEKAGLVSVWNDNGAYVSLWRSVFVRFAWEVIEPIEGLIAGPIGQGNSVRNPSAELLDLITTAYEKAAVNQPEWDGHTYYVSFGENGERDWDDARELGFVSAGGGAWYSKTLRQLKNGDLVYAYIPKGNGVGGYVGYGEVTGPAQIVNDLRVQKDGQTVSLADASRVDMTRGGTMDPDIAEWVVPVRWIRALTRDEAVKDSDFFANQNSAVRLTHGYTLKRLADEFRSG